MTQERSIEAPRRAAVPAAPAAPSRAPSVAEAPAAGAGPTAPAAAAGSAAQAAHAAPPAPKVEIPERPSLAPGIELRGQMKESAFEEEPWLIDRGGRFVQVPRLLYVVAEAADGQRTVEEMAQAVSIAIQRDVTPDNIRQIVGNLVLSGILRKADGSVVELKNDPGLNPLSMNMRMAMLPAGLIEPVTAIFRILFWPPIVLAVVVAGIVAEVWLYAIHGVGGGIHQAFYGPGLMLALVGVVVIAAGIHEFGHAAALRYGGGKVGGMGAGLYLIYPAFYTDVTDNYRLPRWSRVRTDLGGLYFNVITALVVMGLYFATGWEFLLVVVAIINLEMIHQLMPFVRLDGYWTLADISGIPDFFSQVGPFLRSILPSWVPLPKGPALPPIKTWARLVFIVYILVTIPLLLFILFLLVRTVPRLLATVVDAVGQHLATVGSATASGDWITGAAAAVQIVLLALPTIGTAWILFIVGKRALLALWNWSKGSLPKRAVAGLAVVGVASLVVLLWAPYLIIPGTESPFAPGQAFAGAVQFEPIRPNEAFTVTDVVAGATAPPTTEPAPGQQPAPGGGAQPSPTADGGGDPTPVATAAPTTPPEATSTPAPDPTPTPIPSPST